MTLRKFIFRILSLGLLLIATAAFLSQWVMSNEIERISDYYRSSITDTVRERLSKESSVVDQGLSLIATDKRFVEKVSTLLANGRIETLEALLQNKRQELGVDSLVFEDASKLSLEADRFSEPFLLVRKSVFLFGELEGHLVAGIELGGKYSHALVEELGLNSIEFSNLSSDGFVEVSEDVYVKAQVSSLSTVQNLSLAFGALIVAAFGLFGAVYFVLNRFESQFRPIVEDFELASAGLAAGEIVQVDARKHPVKEVQEISSSLSVLLRDLKDYDQRNKALLKDEAYAHMAEEIAHDLRAPMEVLKSSLHKFDRTDSGRGSVKHATQRLTEIAAKLRRRRNGASKVASELSVTNLTELLLGLIEEQEAHAERHGVQIREDIAYGIFARVNPTELERSVSNLIQNSIEAGARLIQIDLSRVEDKCRLVVSDDGKGLPENILDTVFERGFSEGKANGTGLGLFQVKRTVDTLSGSIKIDRSYTRGTKFEIDIPLSKAPQYYVDGIDLSLSSNIVVVDDEDWVHCAWQERFQGKKLVHFSSPEDLIGAGKFGKDTVFLIDQRFLNSSITGIELVRKLNIAEQSIIVTDLAEQALLASTRVGLSVKILDKNLIPVVPIILKREQQKGASDAS